MAGRSKAMRRVVLTAVAGLVVIGLSAVAPAVRADNWPQWRGPTLDGRSAETDIPVAWGSEHNVAWKLPLPARSGSTPIVWGERIFLNVSQDPEKDDSLALWCVDRTAGTLLWKRPLGGGNELKYKQHLSSPSPVTDGRHVWVMTGTGVLAAFTVAGEPAWSRNLQEDYGAFGLQWGYASSPLLFNGALYVQVLHGMHTDDPSYLLKIDPASGKTLWRVERPTDAIFESPDAYTTPAVWQRGGKSEIVISGGDVVTGHDPASGRELWRVDGLNPENSKAGRVVASPLAGDGRLFAFGKRGPVLAIAAGSGEAPPKLAWTLPKGTDVPTPVTDGRLLYIVDDKGLMTALDAATGATVWGPQRLAVGTYSASPVLVDGRIYAVSEAGVTSVVRAGDTFELLAENDLGGYTLSSPAVSDGQLFLRTADYLWAVGTRRGAAAKPPAAAEGR
jgi:outer membrane protein assembly factor BamB